MVATTTTGRDVTSSVTRSHDRKMLLCDRVDKELLDSFVATNNQSCDTFISGLVTKAMSMPACEFACGLESSPYIVMMFERHWLLF